MTFFWEYSHCPLGTEVPWHLGTERTISFIFLCKRSPGRRISARVGGNRGGAQNSFPGRAGSLGEDKLQAGVSLWEGGG